MVYTRRRTWRGWGLDWPLLIPFIGNPFGASLPFRFLPELAQFGAEGVMPIVLDI
jgi:hypothetical protein